MKQRVESRAEWKNYRESRSAHPAVFTCLLLIFCLSLSASGYAGTAHDEYRKIQKEIKKQKQKIEEIRKHESSVLTDIEDTNKQLKDVEADLRKYRSRLSDTEAGISKLEADIRENKKNIERHREWLNRKLRAIHRYGNNSDTVFLLMSADDISQLMRQGKYLQFVSVYEHRLLDRYKGSLESLSRKESQLVSLKRDLQKNQDRVKNQEDKLSETLEHKEVLLSSVRKQQASHTRVLKELQDASNRILDIIRESEKAQRGKEEILAGKGFGSLKARLPWPVEGKVAIRYGSQKDPQFNTPIFRSGAFIQADDTRSYAKAVHGGKVVFAEWFKGYGQMVIINHGDGYHTLYGSLSEIFAKVGDIIKGKQAVGRVGTSGLLTSPGLYFELRYKGKPLDPLQWLQRR
jgi:murein hydrolase activator